MSLPQIQKNDSRIVFVGSLLIALLTAVLTFRSILSTPISIDSYTHFAIGQYILEHHTIPHHDDISFKKTDPSLEWVSHSWISDVLLYIAHRPQQIFGVFFLVLPLLFLSAYLTGLLLHIVIPKSYGPIYLCIPIICSLSFWRYHPFIFVVPLQIVLMILLHRWHHHPKSVLAIPLLFILWANMSGGTIAIPALYLIAVVALELILHRKDHTRARGYAIKSLIAIVPISFVASLINPYGIRIWVYTLTTVAVVQQNRAFASLIGAINTINQTYNKQQFSSLYLVLFSLYVALLLISFVSILVKKPASLTPITRSIPSLLFFPLAFFWIRFIPLAVFSTLPLFVWCMEETKTQLLLKSRINGTYVVLTLTIIAITWTLLYPPILAAPKIPIAHAQRIRAFSLPANILTTYDITGFIMYSLPEYTSMVDAQDDLLNDESLISFYQPVGNFSQSFTAISDTLSVQTALVSRDIGGLSSTLSQSDTWNLLYVDYDAALYVHQRNMDHTFLQKNTMHTMRLDTNLGFDPLNGASAAAELEIFSARYPDNTLLLGQLATIYRINKDFDRAENTMQRIPKNLWNFSLFTEYGRLKAAKGQCIDAETYFLHALSFRNEKNYSRTVLDLAVLYAGCFKDTKRAKHYFIRYNSFLITTSEREKLHMLTKQFGIDMNQ